MSSIDIVLNLIAYLYLAFSFTYVVVEVLPSLITEIAPLLIQKVIEPVYATILSVVRSISSFLAHVCSFERHYNLDYILDEVVGSINTTMLFIGLSLKLLVVWIFDAIMECFSSSDYRPTTEFVDGPPKATRLPITGPPFRALITAPCSTIAPEQSADKPPERPPNQLLINGPPPRFLLEGPPNLGSIPELPNRLLLTAVPIRGLLENPPLNYNSTIVDADNTVPSDARAGVESQRKVSASASTTINGGDSGMAGNHQMHCKPSNASSFPQTATMTHEPEVEVLRLQLPGKAPSATKFVAGSIEISSSSICNDSHRSATSFPSTDSENSAPSSVPSLDLLLDSSDITPPTSPELALPLKLQAQALGLVKDDDDADKMMVQPKPKFRPRAPFDPLSLFNSEDKFLRKLKLDSPVPIAAGGFGRVWKATGANEKVYALKLIERRPGLEALLRRELRALRYARGSPWAVGAHHVDAAGKHLLLVMDFYNGGDLMDLWEEIDGAFDPDLAIFWAAELILAIHDLHLRGIVHRDIKFENIMLDNGHVRIIDFGLAVTFDHDKVSNEPPYDVFHRLKAGKYDSFPPLQNVKCNPHILFGATGTPGYIPPEALAQRGYSFGVDYYAMGVILHGMLTDSLPYVLCDELEAYDYTEFCIDSDGVLDPVERDFLEQVLSPNPHNRPSLRHMKAHPIFSHIDWDALAKGELDPPGLY